MTEIKEDSRTKSSGIVRRLSNAANNRLAKDAERSGAAFASPS
ncbi:hypothetical protein [Desulfobacula sp.]|nr:hypothetical protein [Desulfobacula sp.]